MSDKISPRLSAELPEENHQLGAGLPEENRQLGKELPEEYRQPEVRLPFWMSGPELTKLTVGVKKWWDKVAAWAIWPARQMDPLTCSLSVLGLVAWQRNITRYAGEPERLFRLRVKHAYANGKDSGSTAGWQRIFKRLELGKVELEERVAGQDWDEVNILVDDADLPDSQNVLEFIISDYGRTCRRYRFFSRVTHRLALRVGSFDDCQETVCAQPSTFALVEATPCIGCFENHQHTCVAQA